MPIANSYNTSNVTQVVPLSGPTKVSQVQATSTSTVAPAERKTVVSTSTSTPTTTSPIARKTVVSSIPSSVTTSTPSVRRTVVATNNISTSIASTSTASTISPITLTAPSPTPPITPGSATGTNPIPIVTIVPDPANLTVASNAIPEAVPTPQLIIPTPANTVVEPDGFIGVLGITLPGGTPSSSGNITNIYNTYLSNVAIYDEGDLITEAVTEMRFTGDGVTVTGSGIAYITIPGFFGIAVQDEGSNVATSANTINFVGNGVSATNVGGVPTVTITSSGIQGIAVQDEGTNVVATANKINFVGNGVSASNVGGTATVTITSSGIQGIAVQDDGSNVVNSANTINFIGNGVTASDVGGIPTISITSSGIQGVAIQEEGTNVLTTANTINFVGSGVTASNVGNVATITISGGGGSTGIAVQDEGTNVVADANTINFVGNGVAASNVSGVPTITITSGGIQGITVQEEGTNVLTTANTINFVGSSVTASNVGNVATITISGAGGGSNIANGTSNVDVSTSGGNVTTSVNGNANIVVVTGTGANINGYANISGNLSAGNLSVGNISSNLIPSANVTYDIGNATYRWKDLYLSESTIYLGTTATLSAGIMTNGNSNVGIPVANGNINMSVAGNTNVVIFTGTGANIRGYANVTGNFTASGANVSLGSISNLHITGGTNGYVLQTDGAGNLSWTAQAGGGGNGVPGGANTQVQFNNDGNFAGNSGFTFDSAGGQLSVPGNVVVGNATGGNLTGANVVFSNSFVSNGGNVDFATNNPNVKLGNVANVHIGGGVANYVLTTDGAGNLSWAIGGSGGGVAGSNTQVQFNDAGVMGANANLTFDKTNGNLTVGSNVVAVNFIGSGANTPTIQSGTNLDIIANAGVRVPSNISMTGANVSLGAVANVHITGGTGGQVLRTDGAGNLSWVNPASGGNGVPAGLNAQIQYNDNGNFGANTNFMFDYANSNLYVGNINNSWIDPVLGTARGNLFVRGQLTVGSSEFGSGTDTEAVIKMLDTTSAYGFTTLSAGILAITNEEASLNQAIILGDSVKGNSQTIFGVSTYAGGSGTLSTGQPPEVWLPVLDVRGNNFFVPVIASAAPTGNALYFNPANGRVTYGTASGIAVQDEGSNVVTTTSIVNFVGNGVVASNVGGVATITIPGNDGNGNPGGANTQVQYNDDGIFGGNPGFTFDEGNTVVTANNFVATSTANLGDVGNVTILGGSANLVLTTDGNGVLSWSNGSAIANVAAGGANTQVQYNDDGILGGNPAFTFDEGTTLITANNLAVSSKSNLNSVSNVTILGGNNGYYLQTDGTGNLTWAPGSNSTGNGSVAGANTQIQFNDEGNFGAVAGFTFDKVSTVFTANNIVATSTANLGDVGNVTILGGNANFVLTTDGSGALSWTDGGSISNVAAGGANTQVQYNDDGILGGNPAFTFDELTSLVTANNLTVTSITRLGAVANVHIDGGNANFVLTTDGTGNLTWANLASSNIGNIRAAGANTQVQYNDDGVLGGSSAFTFDEGLTLITANNFAATSTANLGDIGNITILGGNNGYFLQTDGAGNLTWSPASSNAEANSQVAGANTQIQFNDEGNFGAAAGFTFNKTTTTLTANNITGTGTVNFLTTSNVSLGAVANVHIDGGTANFVLTTDGSGNLSWANLASSNIGNIRAAGSNTQVQYNDNGVLGGNPAFTFDEGTTLITANNLTVSAITNLGAVANVHIDGGNNGYYLQTDGTGNLTWAPGANSSGNAEVAGANTQIQFNDEGNFGAVAGFTFDKTTTIFTANNIVATSTANLGNVANVFIGGGNANFVLTTNGSGNLTWSNVSSLSNIKAAGANTQVQYNDDGVLGGNPAFTFDEGLSLITANNFAATSSANLGDVANIWIGGGDANFVLTTDGSGALSWANLANGGAGNIKAAGANTQIQYNDDGVLGGHPGLVFDEGLSLITANNLTVSSITELGDLGNVHITGGNPLDVIATIDGTGNLAWATIITNEAAGANTQVQYNDDGILGGNPTFTFDEVTSLVTVNNFAATSTANLGEVANVTILGGTANYVLTTDGAGNLSWAAGGGGGGTPGGSNTQIQYNDNGVFSGDSAFTFNEANTLVTANNLTVTSVTNLGAVANVHITGGTNGYVLTTDGSGTLSWTTKTGAAGNGIAGGADTQVQYNDAGDFGGNPTFTFNEGSTTLTANNFVVTSTANLGAVGNVTITGGNSGQYLTTDGTGNLSWAAGGVGTPGGSNTQMQFNDNGSFGGSPTVTYADVFGGRYLTISGNTASDAAVVYEYGDPANVAVTGIASSEGNIFVSGYAGAGRSKVAIEPGVNGNIILQLGSSGGTIQMGAVDAIEILGGTSGQVLATAGDGNLYWTTASGGAGGNISVYEGLDLIATANSLYFNGPLVDVTNVFDTPQVQIGLTVKDEGNTVGIEKGFGTLNFTGAGVTVTQSGTTATVNIPSSGGGASASAPYVRVWTGTGSVQNGGLYFWYPIPLDNSAIVNTIGAVDYINGVTYLPAGTYYFESTIHLRAPGSRTIASAYACLIANPSISLDPILGTLYPDNFAPWGEVIAKAGTNLVGNYQTLPIDGVGTFTLTTGTYVSLAFSASSAALPAVLTGDVEGLGYNTTIFKLWKTA